MKIIAQSFTVTIYAQVPDGGDRIKAMDQAADDAGWSEFMSCLYAPVHVSAGSVVEVAPLNAPCLSCYADTPEDCICDDYNGMTNPTTEEDDT